MIYKDIMTRKSYTKDGEEKSVWQKVGTLKEFEDGKQFVELFMYPETSFYVFEQKPRGEDNMLNNIQF